MEPQHKPTKKELKEQRRLERLQQAAAPKQNNSSKWIILGVVIVAFIALFGYVIYSAKQQNSIDAAKPVKLASTGWIRGSATAPNTLTEFADLQCPACKFYEPMVEQLLSQEKGRLKLQFKYFPLQGHQYAMNVARGAEAAGQQGKFWEMHDKLFDQQEQIEGSPTGTQVDQYIDQIAQSLGLDMTKFHKDFNAQSTENKILQMRDEGINIGVNATPTFYVNGHVLLLTGDYNQFKQKVESYFKK